MSATALRNDIQLISVIMAGPDSKTRFKEAAQLLDYGFGKCRLYTDEEQMKYPPLKVRKGVQNQVTCHGKETFRYLDTDGKDLAGIQRSIQLADTVTAPVQEGDTAGYLIYTLDGKEIGRSELVFDESVEKAGYGYSDIVEVDRDVASMVMEVRSALNGAGIEAPYVLLPHSMSGLEAIYWVQNYPDEISGIIGIDMAVPDAYDKEYNLIISKTMMTLGRASVKLGLLRIPGIYPLNEAPLTEKEAKQQRLLMYRNAVNPVYIAEGQKVYENAQTVKTGGAISCPVLMFCSDGTEIGDFWIPTQEKFAEENQAKIICFDCGHNIHYYKSEEMVDHIESFLAEIIG